MTQQENELEEFIEQMETEKTKKDKLLRSVQNKGEIEKEHKAKIRYNLTSLNSPL